MKLSRNHGDGTIAQIVCECGCDDVRSGGKCGHVDPYSTPHYVGSGPRVMVWETHYYCTKCDALVHTATDREPMKE